jgi:hypothetical protein
LEEKFMIVRRLFASALALSCCLVSGAASAEDITYKFDDDLLDAEGIDIKAARIHVRQPQPISDLIRPRVSFVPELLKSVEHL